jgi:uncharacterized membrane protein YtjA (UPF0391 family)
MFTIAAVLLGLAILVVVLGFSTISGPYIESARIVSYSILVLLFLAFLIGLLQQYFFAKAGP